MSETFLHQSSVEWRLPDGIDGETATDAVAALVDALDALGWPSPDVSMNMSNQTIQLRGDADVREFYLVEWQCWRACGGPGPCKHP